MTRWFPFPLAWALLPLAIAAMPSAGALGDPAAPAPAPAADLDAPTRARADAAREAARTDATAWTLLESLVTEVGPRLAGSDGDARAVAWAVARLKALGFDDVRAEPVTVPKWVRGEARVAITAPWPQDVVALALGGSVATAPEGLEAEVVAVGTLDEIQALTPERARGRIVFANARMERTTNGSGYGRVAGIRSRGAALAARAGAVALVMRSTGTSPHRFAHTGMMRIADGVPPIPAFALSNPDADLVERQLASGRPVRMRVFSSSRWDGEAVSANVVGDLRGRERPGELVVLGAHLDSWDVGPGAQDDASGVAAVIAAARLAATAGRERPRRTLRVVLFANEEFGIWGARAYARDHAAEMARHVAGMENDLGVSRFAGLSTRVGPERLPQAQALVSVVEPLGIRFSGNDADGDADVGRLRAAGVPVFDFHGDASRYFDVHHSPDDTLDAVDREAFRQNVAAMAALAAALAEMPADLGRLPAE